MYPLVEQTDLEQRVKLFLTSTRPELATIRVRAQGSTVRLSGEVATFYLRQLALSAVQRVAGVQTVADDIEVAFTRGRPPCDASVGDEWPLLALEPAAE